ncbi:MAG: hypothetical protein ACRDFQ_00440 [Anaerolineales bacterium]
MTKKLALGALLFASLFAFFLATSQRATALQGDGPLRREVNVVFDQDYDVFIGNGGVFIDDSKHLGTFVLRSEQFPAERIGWHQFTQKLLDLQMYTRDGEPFEWVYGVVRVYFNLDKSQYDKWVDETSNMNIWYYNKEAGGWRKCDTHWEPVSGNPQGRLWCVVRYWTRYGIAWTRPTLKMKFEKLYGTYTPTPTRTPTATPTP